MGHVAVSFFLLVPVCERLACCSVASSYLRHQLVLDINHEEIET